MSKFMAENNQEKYGDDLITESAWQEMDKNKEPVRPENAKMTGHVKCDLILVNQPINLKLDAVLDTSSLNKDYNIYFCTMMHHAMMIMITMTHMMSTMHEIEADRRERAPKSGWVRGGGEELSESELS